MGPARFGKRWRDGVMQRSDTGRQRRRSVARATAIVAGLVLANTLATGAMAKKPVPTWTATVAPAQVAAGVSGRALTFTLSPSEKLSGTISLVVPAAPAGDSTPWTAPQMVDPDAPGYVVAQPGTCVSASVASVTGSSPGPWTILVNISCGKGKRATVVYGGGTNTTRITVPTKVGSSAFTTSWQPAGAGGFTPLPVQPTVTIGPAAASSFSVTGLEDRRVAAGTPLTLTVTALDPYGNVATDYRGTIHFALDVVPYDFPEIVPSDYTFTVSDAGAHTFTDGVTLTFSRQSGTLGLRGIYVTDTVDDGLSGLQTVLLRPGPAAQLLITQTVALVSDPTSLPASFPVDLMPFFDGASQVTLVEGDDATVSMCAQVFDAFGNPWLGNDPSQDQEISLTWSVPEGATLPPGLPATGNTFDGDPIPRPFCMDQQLADYTADGQHKAGLTLEASMTSGTGAPLTASQSWNANFVAQDVVVVVDPLPELQGSFFVLPDLIPDDIDVTAYVNTNVDLTQYVQTNFFNFDGSIVAQYADVPMVECVDDACDEITGALSISMTTGTSDGSIAVTDDVWGLADPSCITGEDPAGNPTILCPSETSDGSPLHTVNVLDGPATCTSYQSGTTEYYTDANVELLVVAFLLSRDLCDDPATP